MRPLAGLLWTFLIYSPRLVLGGILYAIMPHNLQCEAIAKFLIPNHPQQDNYPDPDEWEEKEKEWEEKQDLVLVQHVAWVEKEQVVEAKCAMEAACAAVEKQKLWCEV